MTNERGADAICDFMEKKDAGKRTVNYRIRDWLVSRQPYWGADTDRSIAISAH